MHTIDGNAPAPERSAMILVVLLFVIGFLISALAPVHVATHAERHDAGYVSLDGRLPDDEERREDPGRLGSRT
ncbi:MAG: hypothetical protein ACYC7A_04045 [Thermoanaerobaculia bacterium]